MRSELVTNQTLSIGSFIIVMNSINGDKCNLPDIATEFIHSKIVSYTDRTIQYLLEFEGLKLEADDTLIEEYEEGPMPYQVYRRSNGEYLWIRMNNKKEVQLAYLISKDWNYWRLVEDNTKYCGYESFAELSYIFPYSVLKMNGIMFHGVVMEWKGMGIIVCANAGVGKTTHTRMWRDYENAQILNGDRALCYKDGDTWYTSGSPWHGSSGEYKNRNVKLSAVVLLEQALENHIMPLTPLYSALDLIRVTFAPAWDEELMNCAIDHINDVVANIPVYKLMCRPDLEAVSVLKSILNTNLNHTNEAAEVKILNI